MADVIIDKNAKKPEVAPPFEGYSRVVIKTGLTDEEGNEIVYKVGNTTGRTLTVNNPWADQTTAAAILEKIRGWIYQPIKAEDALINPAAEIGDSVIIQDTFSGIYRQSTYYTKLFRADIEAPFEEELDHEYKYESQEERAFIRQLNDATAKISFFADQIEAKVDRNGGTSAFGWTLTDSAWSVFNENGTIFSINANGAYVKGEIRADSGVIGGFNIGVNALWKDITSMSDSDHNGVYIGTDGISLGKGKFKVDSAGNLTAESGSFSGAVYASNIKTDATDGYGGSFPGSGITGGSLSIDQMGQGVKRSLDFADFSNSVFQGASVANQIRATNGSITSLSSNNLYAARFWLDGDSVGWQSKSIVTWVGQEQAWAYAQTDQGSGMYKAFLLYHGTNVLSSSGSISYLG